MNKNSSLIIYFSRADENYNVGNLTIGNTEVIANYIKELCNSEMHKVERVKDYPKAYTPCTEEAKDELKKKARPNIKNVITDISKYDIIFIGGPVWWGTYPCPLFTQLEKLNYKGKIIMPFTTHEGSGLGSCVSDVKKICHDATVKDGLAIQGSTVKRAKDSVKAWIEKNLK